MPTVSILKMLKKILNCVMIVVIDYAINVMEKKINLNVIDTSGFIVINVIIHN